MMLEKTIKANTGVYWCSSCLTMSTRPRISFDKNGICNACIWNRQKKIVNWEKRKKKLEKILKEVKKNKTGDFDCIVPVSGGKDGSYVCYKLINEFNVKPLAVTINPPLRTEIGKTNLENFSRQKINLITLDLDYEVMRKMNLYGFKYKGMPYFGWLVAIMTAPLRIAKAFNINLLFYGEDGEVEYGGLNKTKNNPYYSIDYQKKVYMENGYDKIIKKINSQNDYFFKYPIKDKDYKKIKLTHWSYFENWDPYRNYIIAKKFFGLQENIVSNIGTFTNFAQNDQFLYSLHTYLMYLKFGFGRANQDACIEIRRGAMDRKQGINLVKLYDNQYPGDLVPMYLDYYKITKKEFDETLDKFANKNLFKKVKGYWKPKFEIK